jgi:hypothetical protein
MNQGHHSLSVVPWNSWPNITCCDELEKRLVTGAGDTAGLSAMGHSVCVHYSSIVSAIPIKTLYVLGIYLTNQKFYTI